MINKNVSHKVKTPLSQIVVFFLGVCLFCIGGLEILFPSPLFSQGQGQGQNLPYKGSYDQQSFASNAATLDTLVYLWGALWGQPLFKDEFSVYQKANDIMNSLSPETREKARILVSGLCSTLFWRLGNAPPLDNIDESFRLNEKFAGILDNNVFSRENELLFYDKIKFIPRRDGILSYLAGSYQVLGISALQKRLEAMMSLSSILNIVDEESGGESLRYYYMLEFYNREITQGLSAPPDAGNPYCANDDLVKAYIDTLVRGALYGPRLLSSL